jgi:hypothetical protein
MDYYKNYVRFIFVVKITFMILAVYEMYIKRKEPKNTTKIDQVQHLKEGTELLFKGLMSLLLIYLFNPRTTTRLVNLDYETKLLLYLFGFILIITANWNSIIHNIPETFKIIQQILGKIEDKGERIKTKITK